jgi:hypothetical protein
MKELREDLRYAQMQMRLSLMSLKSSREAVTTIANKMKKLQEENKCQKKKETSLKH